MGRHAKDGSRDGGCVFGVDIRSIVEGVCLEVWV